MRVRGVGRGCEGEGRERMRCFPCLQFETDICLIFTNCIEYNGEDSEYSELANQMLEEFKKQCKVHLEGGDVKVSLPE